MIKIVNGIKYNTETADQVAQYFYSDEYNTDDYCLERLFRKTTGQYFLCCEGGRNTKYARIEGHYKTSGTVIISVDEAGAKKWAENRISVDQYENIFGIVEE